MFFAFDLFCSLLLLLVYLILYCLLLFTLKFPSTLIQFFTVHLNLSKELATLRVVINLLLLNKKIALGHHASPVSHVLMGANQMPFHLRFTD